MKMSDAEPLEADDFDALYRDTSFFGATAGSFLKHAPWVNNLMQSLPNSIAEVLHPAMASFVAQKRVCVPHCHSEYCASNCPCYTGSPQANQSYSSKYQRRS